MTKVLTINDISCVGRCSYAVILPILSHFKMEVNLLPTALLSAHTGFKGSKIIDLTSQLEAFYDHFKGLNASYDIILTGYLLNSKQLDFIIDITKKSHSLIIVDPVMADNGKFYSHFDMQYANKMWQLCKQSDIIIPNITELFFLLNRPYNDNYTIEDIQQMIKIVSENGIKKGIITGVSFDFNKFGIVCFEKDTIKIIAKEKIPVNYAGTGDIFASVFVGYYKQTNNFFTACQKAIDWIYVVIKETYLSNNDPRFGVPFEKYLDKI